MEDLTLIKQFQGFQGSKGRKVSGEKGGGEVCRVPTWVGKGWKGLKVGEYRVTRGICN